MSGMRAPPGSGTASGWPSAAAVAAVGPGPGAAAPAYIHVFEHQLRWRCRGAVDRPEGHGSVFTWMLPRGAGPFQTPVAACTQIVQLHKCRMVCGQSLTRENTSSVHADSRVPAVIYSSTAHIKSQSDLTSWSRSNVAHAGHRQRLLCRVRHANACEGWRRRKHDACAETSTVCLGSADRPSSPEDALGWCIR